MVISTSIDDFLNGGLRAGHLIELVGPSSSGKTQDMQSGCRARMLIIDSISSLITPVLGGSGAHGRALMASAGFILKQLADEHNLPVLVTNHMVAGEAGILKPALGESWKSIPHIRLLLSRDSARHISSISVLKHPNMVCSLNRCHLLSLMIGSPQNGFHHEWHSFHADLCV
nr:DNA repair protein RAD51 homolog 4 isoform X1 [Ipomoea batatas]